MISGFLFMMVLQNNDEIFFGIITILLKKYWPGMFTPDPVNHPERKILATCWDHYEVAFHLAYETAAKAVISNFWVSPLQKH